MRTLILIFLNTFFPSKIFVKAQTINQVGLYRTFERSLENNNQYSNKFSDVELTCSYISPSGDTTGFYGFFDGDGNGGGDKQTGNVWKFVLSPMKLVNGIINGHGVIIPTEEKTRLYVIQ